jgi:hypothetical protein
MNVGCAGSPSPSSGYSKTATDSEREVNSGVRGNGVAVFPYTRLNGVRHISLVELGDEDGSDLGDEFAIGLTLREAVDAARHQPASPSRASLPEDSTNG